jgi:hypothetical protein
MGIAASSFLNPIAAEPEFVPVLPDTPECAAEISDRLLARAGRAPYAATAPCRHRIIAA